MTASAAGGTASQRPGQGPAARSESRVRWELDKGRPFKVQVVSSPLAPDIAGEPRPGNFKLRPVTSHESGTRDSDSEAAVAASESQCGAILAGRGGRFAMNDGPVL